MSIEPAQYASLDEKASAVFQRLAIDKRRLPSSSLTSRGMPVYVAEWVLDTVVPGVGPLTAPEIAKINDWAGRYVPAPNDHKIYKHKMALGESVKVLTSVEAEVKLKKGKEPERYAKLEALKIDEAFVAPSLLSEHQDLMRHGMWGVAELAQLSDGPGLLSFRPMQATVNLDLYQEARKAFELNEWRSLLLTSMGYIAESFTDEQQTLLLCRLLPLVQKNMHLMELAPKGTGKSYIFENISTKVRLVSGGNISPAVLFVNNASGQLGILVRFAVVVLDEVQTLKFDKPEEIVGGLKGYLANGKITRGGLHETASDCGLVMLANIALDDQQRPLNDLIVKELPIFLQETAFLDRMKGIIPGWKLPKLSSKLLIGANSGSTVGLKADFFGDVLLALRNDSRAEQYCAQHIHLSGDKPYRRNEESVRAIAAGLMKIQFPHGEVSPEDFSHYCLKPALELRQNVWGQLYQLDSEYRQYEEFLQAK